MCPAPLTPGSDCVRAIGGARLLAADRDREWPPDNKGDALRVRKGSWLGAHEGEIGEVGEGSVERRKLGGFRGLRLFGSGGARVEECETLCSRGLERNSSILSVSGTGSIVDNGLLHCGGEYAVCFDSCACCTRYPDAVCMRC